LKDTSCYAEYPHACRFEIVPINAGLHFIKR